MRHRLARTLACALMLASLSSVGVAAGATRDSDVGIVSPGPLGRPFPDIVAEHESIFEDLQPTEDRCALGDRDELFFLPPGSTDCTVRADQHILVPITGRRCEIPTRLLERARRDRLPRAQGRRALGQEAATFRCLHVLSHLVAGPYLAVDEEPIPIDETFLVTTPPRSEEGRTTWDFGYYVLLEPLPVGEHTIVRGHSAFPESPLRVESTLEVVAGSD
jgi:hypothetical protein